MNLSVIILTKNEGGSIKRCIESVSFADEIIVLDDFSTDDTLTVIKSLNFNNISIHKRKLENDFSDQRNFGIEKAKGKWILFVDADEVVSDKLKNEILSTISKTFLIGFSIPRVDFLWGKELQYGELSGFKLLRLAKKGAGKWYGKVHEEWKIEGKTGVLKNEIQHFPHQSVTDFLTEINYYSSLRAQEIKEKGKRVGVFEIISYPLAKFVVNYFLKRGFLDGVEGFVFAMMMSFHSFLVRAKTWNYNSEKDKYVL